VSAGAHTVTVAARYERRSEHDEVSEATRYGIRIVTFAALATYGAVRWATLLNPAPSWRLYGLVVLAVGLAAGIPLLRRLGTPPAIVATLALCLLAFPIAGLQWHSFLDLRVAVSARHVGDGLLGLPNALVPYAGSSQAVRMVICLGAAILLLDAAVVIAFSPDQFGDARRAGAALPLIALAVVPATLVRPQLPYLQGLALFALLAAFVWGERVRRDAARTAFLIAALAGIVAAFAAPRLDGHKALIDYRTWTGSISHSNIDSFDWNQTYGPLHWPHSGHEVLTIRARTPEYWKAEDLDLFNGIAWVLGSPAVGGPPLPKPSKAALARWSEQMVVNVQGMTTNNVIAAGEASQPSPIPGGIAQGADPGTWMASRSLGPGSSYAIKVYSPNPTPEQLQTAGRDYPYRALAPDLTVTVPETGLPSNAYTQVTFPGFHTHRGGLVTQGGVPIAGEVVPKVLAKSPYARTYALAQRLKSGTTTQYAYVQNVLRFLSRGYTYNQNPPLTGYPIETFLFSHKAGYCQQFSGSMALLLRMAGIPARVASGFTSGDQDATGEWVVSDLNAHAWVEVWFPTYGWVRFDPTPPVAPAREQFRNLGVVKPTPNGPGSTPSGVNRNASVGGGSHGLKHRSPGGPSPLLIVPVLLVIAALAWLGRILFAARPGPEDRLAEIERALARTGRPLSSQTTLAALEHRFRDSPEASGYLRALRLIRYGGGAATPSKAGRRALRTELRQGLGLSGRLRALWALPPEPRLPSRGLKS
jgi:transglutaminase-like putative cysteine protease